jgi:hypothetical protein
VRYCFFSLNVMLLQVERPILRRALDAITRNEISSHARSLKLKPADGPGYFDHLATK